MTSLTKQAWVFFSSTLTIEPTYSPVHSHVEVPLVLCPRDYYFNTSSTSEDPLQKTQQSYAVKLNAGFDVCRRSDKSPERPERNDLT
jgi:hypothetical protein